jgi:lipoate-protein ligase A
MVSLKLNPMQRDLQLFADYDTGNETKAILFFYIWDHIAITLGKIQKEKNRIINAAQALDIPCYLRPTGGRAVLHGGDICYTFIAPQSHAQFGGKLKESYKATNRFVIDLVSQVLDLQIQTFTGELSKTEPINCFGSFVCNEGILVHQNQIHKIIGAAQALGKRAFIQQGSIQLNKVELDLPFFAGTKTLSEITSKVYSLKNLCENLNKRCKGVEV